MAAPILPKAGPDDSRVGTSMRMPIGLKRQLEEIAQEHGISFSDVSVEFLKWAVGEWLKENPKK